MTLGPSIGKTTYCTYLKHFHSYMPLLSSRSGGNGLVNSDYTGSGIRLAYEIIQQLLSNQEA